MCINGMKKYTKNRLKLYLSGFKQFGLADRLAGLCESVLGAVTHGERDEEQEWYTFAK